MVVYKAFVSITKSYIKVDWPIAIMDILIRDVDEKAYEEFKKITSEKERTVTAQLRLMIKEFVADNK